MEAIRLHDNDEIVWVHFSIETQAEVHWRYKYLDDGFNHQNSQTQKPPFRHALGFFLEKLDDTDMFSITLQNLSGSEQPYTFKVVWYQGKQQLHEWQSTGKMANMEQAVARGEVRFVKG